MKLVALALLLAACKQAPKLPAKALAAIKAGDADAWSKLQGFRSEEERQRWVETSGLRDELARCQLAWADAKQVSLAHEEDYVDGEQRDAYHYVFATADARLDVVLATADGRVVDEPRCHRLPFRAGDGFAGAPHTLTADGRVISYVAPPDWRGTDGHFDGPAGLMLRVRADCGPTPALDPLPCTQDVIADVVTYYEERGHQVAIDRRDADWAALSLDGGEQRTFTRVVTAPGWGRATCLADLVIGPDRAHPVADPALFDDLAALCREVTVR